MNGQRLLCFLAEAIPRCICIKFYHWANNRGKYGNGLYKLMIDNKDGHITSPMIMFTCTTLHHALLQWQKNKGDHSKASKSQRNADRPDRSNNFNHKNDGGQIASCCAATGRKSLTLPDAADMYTFLVHTSSTLPERYKQSVYKNTLATIKRQILQAENQTPATVISTEATCVDNAIFLDYFTFDVALEDPEIGSTDPNIPIHNNCTDNALHFGTPGGCDDSDNEGDEIDESDAIPTACRQRRATTELERFYLGTSDVVGYEGDDGDDADADKEEDASQADIGLMPTFED
jgi:hypothetical protein